MISIENDEDSELPDIRILTQAPIKYWQMFLVQFLWETEGELQPLVDVHPHLPCVTQVMVNILDIPGKMTSLCSKTQVVLLLVLRQAANLVLRGYKAPHLLGEVANPLFPMFQY